MHSKKLLILGASRVQLPAIKYAKSAGYQVIACDSEDHLRFRLMIARGLPWQRHVTVSRRGFLDTLDR